MDYSEKEKSEKLWFWEGKLKRAILEGKIRKNDNSEEDESEKGNSEQEHSKTGQF